jgi:hypothetical protein
MPNPFNKPTTPKNSLQLLQWLIFEPVLLEQYEKTLTKIQTRKIALRAIFVNFFIVIIPLTLLLYAISLMMIAYFDLPLIFPPNDLSNIEINEVFVQQWPTDSRVWEKVYFFTRFDNYQSLRNLYEGFSIALGIGLVLAFLQCLMIDVARNLAKCLAQGLAFTLTFGLIGALLVGLSKYLVLSLVFALAFALSRNLIFAFSLILFEGFIAILDGLSKGLAFNLMGFITYILFYYLTYFRLWFYPWHFVKSLLNVSLTNNPYIGDGVIRLPIWGMNRKLTTLAQQDPKTALAFVNFLQEYRPLQKQLAMHIAHAATAGNWQHHPLHKQYLLSPPLIQETPNLTPSPLWLNQIEKLKAQFLTYEAEDQITLKKAQFEIFCTQLNEFRDLTLREPYRWHHYYLPGIAQWQSAAKEKQAKLTQEAQCQEPITANLYRFGDILDPENDQTIFFGREDIKEELKQEILTARTLPLFLYYGQRRVGKSSLLKFLPRLLGSRFKVVYQDCQSSHVDTLSNWLKDLEQRLNRIWPAPKIDWQETDNGLEAWGKMQHYLENLSQQHQEKIILAFDEYEALHERFFMTAPKEGKMLLEAMRSFSQHQNQIVFLFVGATQFVDLKAPNWDRCFIHAMPLRVDYLSQADATRLITEPVDLHYPTAVIEQMWTVTQGHPALLQMLCRHIVTISNTEGRKNMTLADVEHVISRNIVQRNTNALSTFWTEFCVQHDCRSTIEAILNNQPITDKKSLLKLEDYGYVVFDGEAWRLRVPLLEMWLKRYREAV